MSIFKPIHAKDISKEERKLDLSSLIFLKKKINEYIKGRLCAYGRTKRHTTNREDTTLPNLAPESVFITSTIDAFEGIKVVTMGVPSHFCTFQWTLMTQRFTWHCKENW